MFLPTLKVSFVFCIIPCKAYYETYHVLIVMHSCMYLSSVNFDTLNAVLGIYSIHFADVAIFIPDYRNVIIGLYIANI